MKRKLSNLIFILGFMLILGAIGLTLFNIYDSKRAAKASDEVIEELMAQIDDAIEANTLKEEPLDTDSDEEEDAPVINEEELLEIYELYPELDMPAVEIKGNRYIGTISIPAINVYVPIMEEWSESRLKVSPCRYMGSVYSNDLVICGHNYITHFARLHRLSPGANVYFSDMAGHEFKYSVISVETLSPNAWVDMVEDPADEWDMTLFTCTYRGNMRTAVRLIRAD